MGVWGVAPFTENEVPCPSSLFGAHFQKSSKIMEMTMEVATKKQQALSLLAAGSPLEKVAHSIGVHRATSWRWRKDTKFVAEWNKMLAEMKERQTLVLVKLQEEFPLAKHKLFFRFC